MVALTKELKQQNSLLQRFSGGCVALVVTGHAMASAPVFKHGLSHTAGMAKTPAQAIYQVRFISALACLINWGFGLVIGALFARELAVRIKNVDYRLLIVSAYSGFLFWHGGLSGSVGFSIG